MAQLNQSPKSEKKATMRDDARAAMIELRGDRVGKPTVASLSEEVDNLKKIIRYLLDR
jgi:hypothetical protein